MKAAHSVAAVLGLAVELEADARVGVGADIVVVERATEDGRTPADLGIGTLAIEIQVEASRSARLHDIAAAHTGIVRLGEGRRGNGRGKQHGCDGGLHDTAPCLVRSVAVAKGEMDFLPALWY